MDTRNIPLAAFRTLVASKELGSVKAIGMKGGFTLGISGAAGRWRLSNAKGEPRTFASLNTLSDFLRSCGVTDFEVSASTYEKGRLRKARPDRSAALKKTRTQSTLELT